MHERIRPYVCIYVMSLARPPDTDHVRPSTLPPTTLCAVEHTPSWLLYHSDSCSVRRALGGGGECCVEKHVPWYSGGATAVQVLEEKKKKPEPGVGFIYYMINVNITTKKTNPVFFLFFFSDS